MKEKKIIIKENKSARKKTECAREGEYVHARFSNKLS